MAPAAANRDMHEPTSDADPRRNVFDWLFRDRRTGRVVIAQWPNLALSLFLAATAIRLVAHPAGTTASVLNAAAALTLIWWATDEVARGVNPFRRALGAAVLAATAASFIVR